MLDARAITRLLLDDEQPVSPPDPNQLAPDFNSDEDVDVHADFKRYTSTPLKIRGSGPTTTYQYLSRLFASGRQRRDDHPYVKAEGKRNTIIVNYGDRYAIRFYDTDVVTAYPDGKVVVDTGGWHPGGGQSSPWHGKPSMGETTADRIALISGTDGGWRIYRKDHVWYWYNDSSETDSDVRYPFTPGDTIFPDGSLQIQAQPEYLKKRKRRV